MKLEDLGYNDKLEKFKTDNNRELIVLANGGILVDNPGMREVGIAAHSAINLPFALFYLWVVLESNQ